MIIVVTWVSTWEDNDVYMLIHKNVSFFRSFYSQNIIIMNP